MQDIIVDLRPAALDELGLVAAIEALVDRTTAGSEIDIVTGFELVRSSGNPSTRLDPELENTIYRLVQEALRNVVKHAAARSVELRVRQEGQRIEIMVRDDGRGFERGDPGAGFGLVGMRERTALFGGEIAVSSRLGEGTTVRARLPVRRQALRGD